MASSVASWSHLIESDLLDPTNFLRGGVGASWGVFGASWDRLGASWEGLGAVLRRSWAGFERSWAVLEWSWAVLERSWAILGRSKVVLRRSWGRLGVVLVGLGAILSHLGWAWGDFEPAGGAKNVDFPLVFSMIFGKYIFRSKIVILARLEAILGPLGTRLGLPGGRQGWRTSSARVQQGFGERASRALRDPPPSPKLLAKAKSDMNIVHGAN